MVTGFSPNVGKCSLSEFHPHSFLFPKGQFRGVGVTKSSGHLPLDSFETLSKYVTPLLSLFLIFKTGTVMQPACHSWQEADTR